jgi:MFS superfamily sulfate permease-like transporter
LGSLPTTEIYVDLEKYRNAKEIYGIKIFRFSSPIFYLSIDNFKTKVLKLINPIER